MPSSLMKARRMRWKKAVDREYRKTRIVVQNARAGHAGAAADFGLVEPRLAPQQAHVSAPLPRRQRVDLLQDARLHLLGRLVGEGDRQNRAVTFGTFDDVVHVFVGQLVGFARSGAGVQYFRLTFVACFLPKVRISPQIDAGNGNFRIFDCVLDTLSRHNQAGACFCARLFVSLTSS